MKRSFWGAWKNVLFPSRTLFWIIYMRRRFCFTFTIMVVELELDTPSSYCVTDLRYNPF